MKKLVTAALTISTLFSAVSFITPSSASASDSAFDSAQEFSATSGRSIVNTAKSYQGKVTYKFGVRNPSRLIFDCSSFTQFVFKKNGIDLPWSSKAQAKRGKAVSKSKLSVGDLVMFSVDKPGKIDHVGIYIGNGKMISNMPHKGVSIASINTGYWGSRYITGRHF
ncbi:C40 family peptidase [Paenibacillus medicaginis]|uniref:C40 family peptidase n=1 Tax=Paenibacillus medicaginis TaxID=1470560 RepID=A0ABV5BY39_9BACL